MKITLFCLFLLGALQVGAADVLNCRGSLEDGYQVNLCARVVDTNKLRTINCLEEIEDGYELNLCQNVKDLKGGTLDCTAELGDAIELYLCQTVPVLSTVHYINCLGELEDGYQLNLCMNVDVRKQSQLRNRL